MKKFLLLFLTFISLNVIAQNDYFKIKEGSFTHVAGAVMDDAKEHTDVDDKPMALFKISTENINDEQRRKLYFTGNRVTEISDKVYKTGAVWIYITAQNSDYLEIRHPDYGITRFYFPESLCDFCTYEMVLQYIDPTLAVETGFLAISSEPNEADVYVDGKHYGKTTTVVTDLAEGSHTLKLEKQGYVTLTKTINIVKGETLKVNETLQTLSSQKTYLIVKADQPDARIYIDDNLKNTGEHAESVLIGSTYTYRIECNMYHTETGSVTVKDKTTINKTLRPNFGYISVTTTPEQGAKVFVDGDYLGLSPIKSDKLKSGSHNVMVMKDMYKMKEQSFTVTDGLTTDAVIDMFLDFVSVTVVSDYKSDIYIDNEYKCKGKWIGGLSDGLHVFEARKANHKASKKTIDLVLGKNETITLDAPKPITSSIEINSSPMEANIYIDGKSYGTTPNYVNEILIGTHELKLEKQGCTTITKTINVKEGETLTVNEKLVSQQTTDNRQQASGNASQDISGTINGHEYVDLGLPSGLKWATCNVGANKPEYYGNYFAWGETTTKSTYTQDNSLTYGLTISELQSQGYIDGNGNLTPSYDAATVNWGGSWRIPTLDEILELIDECTWTWIIQGGKACYKVTGPNGNHIFLPAAGFRDGSSLYYPYYAGESGYYWGSTPDESESDFACGLYFGSSYQYGVYGDCYHGQTVRQVSE